MSLIGAPLPVLLAAQSSSGLLRLEAAAIGKNYSVPEMSLWKVWPEADSQIPEQEGEESFQSFLDLCEQPQPRITSDPSRQGLALVWEMLFSPVLPR